MIAFTTELRGINPVGATGQPMLQFQIHKSGPRVYSFLDGDSCETMYTVKEESSTLGWSCQVFAGEIIGLEDTGKPLMQIGRGVLTSTIEIAKPSPEGGWEHLTDLKIVKQGWFGRKHRQFCVKDGKCYLWRLGKGNCLECHDMENFEIIALFDMKRSRQLTGVLNIARKAVDQSELLDLLVATFAACWSIIQEAGNYLHNASWEDIQRAAALEHLKGAKWQTGIACLLSKQSFLYVGTGFGIGISIAFSLYMLSIIYNFYVVKQKIASKQLLLGPLQG